MQTAVEVEQPESKPKIKADAFGLSILLALCLAVVQKSIGLGRTVVLCRLLPDDQLGQWSLAQSFLIFIAPFAVLGLPGCFGRFVEYFRSEKALLPFLRRVSLITIFTTIAGFVLLVVGREYASKVVYGTVVPFRDMLVLAFVFFVTAWFNFVVELVNSLRQIKLAAWMRIVSTTVFSVVSVLLVFVIGPKVSSVLLGYAVGFTIAALLGMSFLFLHRKELLEKPDPNKYTPIWRRIFHYAAWLWVIDAVLNLFAYSDRYMVLHWSGLTEEAAQSAVGQYHAALILPTLFGSVGAMILGALVPNMSVAWEENRKKEAGKLLTSAIKGTALGFTIAGVVLAVCKPLLFDWILQGRYDQGAEIMAFAMTGASWILLATLIQAYHWCAEKGYLTAISFAIGLAVNLVLNAIMIPHYGILGAVIATSIGNIVGLAAMYITAKWIGLDLDWRIWFISLFPVLISLPPLISIAILAVSLVIIERTNWILDDYDKMQLSTLIAKVKSKVGLG